MLVKCQFCGKKVEKATAYREELPNGGRYYCNEAEFLEKKAIDLEKAEAKRQRAEEKKLEAEEKKKRAEERRKSAEEKKKRSEVAKKRVNRIDPVYEAAVDILGYRTENSQFFREMKIWRGICNDEIILAYLSEDKDYITKLMQKDFDSEYKRIRYFSAILKNSLVDFKNEYIPKREPVKVNVDCEIYEPEVYERPKQKSKRRGLSFLEDEV